MAEVTTPTPQAACSPGPATPLRQTLPCVPPAPPGEERGALGLRGGWGCCSTEPVTESQHLNTGIVSPGTVGGPLGHPAPVGSPHSRTRGQGAPGQPHRQGPDTARGTRLGWPPRQAGPGARRCRMTWGPQVHSALCCPGPRGPGPRPAADRTPEAGVSSSGGRCLRGRFTQQPPPHPLSDWVTGPPPPLPAGQSPKVSLSHPEAAARGGGG